MALPGYENLPGLTAKAIGAQEQFMAGIVTHSPDSPVKSKQIEAALQLTGPEVRALVSYLRLQGEPIGSDGKGYYYCLLPGEIQLTIDHVMSRMKKLHMVHRELVITQNRLRLNANKSKIATQVKMVI